MKKLASKYLSVARKLLSALARFASRVAERITASLIATIILLFIFPDLLSVHGLFVQHAIAGYLL